MLQPVRLVRHLDILRVLQLDNLLLFHLDILLLFYLDNLLLYQLDNLLLCHLDNRLELHLWALPAFRLDKLPEHLDNLHLDILLMLHNFHLVHHRQLVALLHTLQVFYLDMVLPDNLQVHWDQHLLHFVLEDMLLQDNLRIRRQVFVVLPVLC